MKKNSGGMKATAGNAKNHAIDKNAKDGRNQPNGLGKRKSSGGEKTYGYGGKR